MQVILDYSKIPERNINLACFIEMRLKLPTEIKETCAYIIFLILLHLLCIELVYKRASIV